jgi:CelD/BcsL family acetyltransferase involved in cellulose biosynthesis
VIELVQFVEQSLPAFDAVDTLVGWGAIARTPRIPRPLEAEIFEGHVPAEVVEPWRALAVRAENPFVTPDWHGAWLEAHPGQHAVVIAARRDDGALAGVVPLVANGERTPTLSAAGGSAADWFSPACRPRDELAVARATGAVLDQLVPYRRWRLDRCLSGGSWAEGLHEELPQRGWTAVRQPVEDVMPVSSFPDGRVNGRGTKDVRRRRRKLEREHDVAFRLSRSPWEVDADLEELLALHAARWGEDTFDEPMHDFQRAFARRAAARGWLRLWTLEVDGARAASLYCLRIGTTTYGYIHAFDREFARQGVGLVLLDHAVGQSVAEGCAEFNFLRGGETYKRRFGAEERRLWSYDVVPQRSMAALSARSYASARAAWLRLPAGGRARMRRLMGR